MNYKGVEFDDVTNGDDGKWSQLCNKHYYELLSLGEKNMTESASDTAICGVEGCDKIAEYYIDLTEA